MPPTRIRTKKAAGSGGGGGGGSAAPTFTYNEALHIRDAGTFGISRNEALHIRDAGSFGISRNEALHIRDAYSLAVTPTYNSHLRVVDAGAMSLTDLIVGRSGTPDTDQMSDGWVDQASSATNHGNESLLAKGNSVVPGSDTRIGFLQVDLTRVTGVTAGTAGGALTFTASTSNGLLATALGVAFAVQAGRWFTESTMTYATGRPNPAFTGLAGPSVAPGAAATYTVTFTQAQLGTMLGKWVLFAFSTPDAALPDTVTILSRDNATASNRPKVTAAFKIP